jgi:hypothetical protein
MVGAELAPTAASGRRHQRTSVPGLYAAGDVVIGLDQISHAMGEGGVAATTIRNDATSDASGRPDHPRNPDWKVDRAAQARRRRDGGGLRSDGTRLSAAATTAGCNVWDLASGPRDKLPRRQGHDLDPRRLARRRAARRGGEDAIVRLDLDRLRAPPRVLRGHSATSGKSASAPTASSSPAEASTRPRAVGRATGQPLRRLLNGHSQAVVGLAFSPDGQTARDQRRRFDDPLLARGDGAPLRTIDAGNHTYKLDSAPTALARKRRPGARRGRHLLAPADRMGRTRRRSASGASRTARWSPPAASHDIVLRSLQPRWGAGWSRPTRTMAISACGGCGSKRGEARRGTRGRGRSGRPRDRRFPA